MTYPSVAVVPGGRPTYPPVNFFFRVAVALLNGNYVISPLDASFQEVSGISAELEVEPYREGGRNYGPHRLPVGTKYSNLVLKRGLVIQTGTIFKWCANTLGNGDGLAMPIVPRDVLVDLLTPGAATQTAKVLKSWIFSRAWPVKWEVSNLNSMGNEVLVETLELTYDRFTVKSPPHAN